MVDPPLRADIRRTTLLAAATSTLMIAQQIASKSLRDALFLVHYSVSSLPILMIAAAVLSFAMVLAMGGLVRRFTPGRVVPAMFVLSGVLYGLEWASSGALPRVVAVIVYAHTVTFGASVVSGFWSVVNERFDPYVAKRVIGRIGGGATLGGLLGGVAVWQGASHVSLEALLLVLSFANAVCGVLLARVVGSGRRAPTSSASGADPGRKESIAAIFRQTPYLRHIAVFVFLSALGTSLFDFVFKARAAGRFSEGDELLTFFALFYTVVGIATFVVQNAFVKRSLVRLGLAPTIGILPSSVVLFSAVGVVFPGFYSAIALRGVAATAENSFHRSAYELLYTPLSPSRKRATKLGIDVGADRAGTALGSGVVLLCLAWMADGAHALMLVLSALLAGSAICFLVWLNRGYVAALAERMRAGAVRAGLELGQSSVDEDTA